MDSAFIVSVSCLVCLRKKSGTNLFCGSVHSVVAIGLKVNVESIIGVESVRLSTDLCMRMEMCET